MGVKSQEFRSEHSTDSNGNPAGGFTSGVGFQIKWQDGPLGRGGDRREPNGAFVETIIEVALDRLEYYQRSPMSHWNNKEAIKHLKSALRHLESRTRDRERRGVEGTHDL
jgi:hypothetical protein